jgi:hypothetical protein
MNRYTKTLATALIGSVMLLSSGCATITRGTEQDLAVESDPAGATVTLSNGMKGTTPTSFKAKRKDSLTVTVQKPGYKTATVQVIPQVSDNGAAGMAGNLLFGGIIGVGVDASNGATKDLMPNPVKVTLEKTK